MEVESLPYSRFLLPSEQCVLVRLLVGVLATFSNSWKRQLVVFVEYIRDHLGINSNMMA